MYYSFYDGPMKGKSVTISEVRVSPDLKNATVFATVLGGSIPKEFIPTLNAIAYEIKRHIAKKIRLRNMPSLYFKTDEQFIQADYIEALIDQVSRPRPAPTSDSEDK